MANTYVVNRESVMGTMRVQFGTITATDGGGATTTYMVDTGLDIVVGAAAEDETGITKSGGSISPSTATSGGTVNVIVFGL